jgi:hypothetical protein
MAYYVFCILPLNYCVTGIYLLVFTVFCIVCTVFLYCFMYVYVYSYLFFLY